MPVDQTRVKANGVSIVICCHNSTKRLPETMAHLAAQQVSAEIPWEVILIDNASTDDTKCVARQLWSTKDVAPLRIVTESRLGLSHARFRGLSEARYEYVSFIDDDNWVASDWVQTVFKVMNKHPDVGACGGVSEGIYEVEPPKWFHGYAGYYAIGGQGEPGDITWSRGILWGAGMTIRKSAWEMLIKDGFHQGLVDRRGTQITSGGDNELCLALRLAGWRIWYESGLALQHEMPASRLRWEYFRQLYRAAGAASAGYDPYLQAIKQSPSTIGERMLQRWSGQAASIVRELALNPRRLVHVLNHAPEGDSETLWFDWRVGRLRELVRQRGDYDHAIAAVRNAPWRKAPAMDSGESFSRFHELSDQSPQPPIPIRSRLGDSELLADLAVRYAFAPSAVLIRTAEVELLRSLPIEEPVLDLCCGDGYFGSLLRPQGFDAGCDISMAALESARTRQIHDVLACADISKGSPFPSGQFNTIVCNSSLEHVPDVDGALREVARVLAPGGRLYVTLASDFTYRWWPWGRQNMERYFKFQPVFNAFSGKEWARRMDAAGLTVVSERYYLSKRVTNLFTFLDYHFSHVYLTRDRTMARPLIDAMKRIPQIVWSRLWRQLFSRISIAQHGKGGGILIVAERSAESTEMFVEAAAI